MRTLTDQDRAFLARVLDRPLDQVRDSLKHEWDLDCLQEAHDRAKANGDDARALAFISRMNDIRSR